MRHSGYSRVRLAEGIILIILGVLGIYLILLGIDSVWLGSSRKGSL